jgi:peroxiredoxin
LNRPTLFACLAAVLLAASVAHGEKKLAVGDKPPDVLGMDVNGKRVKLSDYPGKILVVSFWASWCGPCKQELPVLENLQRAASKYGLEVLAVNWKEDRQVIRNIRRMSPDLQMHLVSDASGLAGKSYGVTGIPHMILIGRDGLIQFVNIGYGESVVDEIVTEVNKALAAGATQPATPQQPVEPSATPETSS